MINILFIAKNKKSPNQNINNGEKISKQILKTGYFYQGIKNFWEDLPELLPVSEKFVKIINDRIMTEREMIEGQKPFTSRELAAGFAAQLVQTKQEGIVWFEDAGVVCSVNVWHYSAGPYVYVRELYPDYRWRAGRVSFFSN